MKEAVALKDVSIIQRESTRLIKSHSKIIETIVKSTKSQLRRYIGNLSLYIFISSTVNLSYSFYE